MSKILFGNAAKINFSQVLMGASALQLGTIPAGIYTIGHKDFFGTNPPRTYTVEKPFGMQTTPFTQSQLMAVREALGDQNHLVTASLPGREQTIVARGTEAAIMALSPEVILEIARERVLEGGCLIHSSFDPFEINEMQRTVFPHFESQQTWKRNLNVKYLGDNYAAHESQRMAKVLAALSLEEYRLATSSEWEVAAGDLRLEMYRDPIKLTEVAVFGRTRDQGPTVVGTKRPNQYGLYDMLGLVWEFVAEEGMVRGGSWGHQPGNGRAAFLNVDPYHPADYWHIFVGFRLMRPYAPS